MITSTPSEQSNILKALPQELFVQIFSLLDFKSLIQLESTSRSFLDFVTFHQDLIWQRATLETIPSETGSAYDSSGQNWSSDLSLEDILASKQDLTEVKDDQPSYWNGVTSWKELCKKQILLSKNWASSEPDLQINHNDPQGLDPNYETWRFRNDFKRRIVILTTATGPEIELKVSDMDDLQKELWSIESTPFTHLEYDDGYFVRDVEYNRLEIWKAKDLDEKDESKRGHFRKISTLHHEEMTRGFHLRYPHLSVVSPEGFVWVYDVSMQPVELIRKIETPKGAIGHLDQNDEVVMPSLGSRGYTIYEKATGKLIGSINPSDFSKEFRQNNIFHISHQESIRSLEDSIQIPLKLSQGPIPLEDRSSHQDVELLSHLFLPEDPLSFDYHWGAGMISGNHMVGISKRGRVVICSDWKGLLQEGGQENQEKLLKCMALIELGPMLEDAFEAGGWLSIGYGRVVFEVRRRIYIFPLPEFNSLPSTEDDQLPIHAIRVTVDPIGWRSVSFMKLFETGILFTTERSTPYATITF